MKIKSIKFGNHPVLKNLEFDFEKDISLLVGENGCGKTIFLEELFKIISGGITIWNDHIDRKIEIEFSSEEKSSLSLDVDIIVFDSKDEYGEAWNKIKIFNQSNLDISGSIMPKIQDGQINKQLKCAYSTVEINFALQNIDSVKATSTDNEEKPKTKSSINLATEIAQLLIDIKAQDDAESAKWMKSNEGINIEVPKVEGKLDRFKKVYSKMFEGKELCDIRPENGTQKILFRNTSDNREFPIENLSSGEKQIVYRIGYLLRNLKTLSGGLILIDEPELSLHPRWQIKFIEFLQEVFSDKNKINMQFVIATHSPYLLKSSLLPEVDVISFTQKNKNVEIEKLNKQSWSLFKNGPTLGEINYYAFYLPTPEFHNELYGHLKEEKQAYEEKDIEKYFISKGCEQNKFWIKINNQGEPQPAENKTLMTFIRNTIHHPENTENTIFTYEELKTSIETMIKLTKTNEPI